MPYLWDILALTTGNMIKQSGNVVITCVLDTQQTQKQIGTKSDQTRYIFLCTRFGVLWCYLGTLYPKVLTHL